LLSIKKLMEIPKQLIEVLRGLDQSLVTAKLSRSMASILGLSTDECNLLYKTAIAHDCGYLILEKDRLQSIIAKKEITEEEFNYIKQHTVKGLEYFQGIELPLPFREGILYHHERNDGSGYPEGLTKEQIPIFAKIIGTAETFSTLLSKRPYRIKRELSQALAIVEDAARTKFDPEIVQALSQVASTVGR
ncbi:MAG TPA: HD domain-containing phosphohydrolase, partial [Spirochaetales bacterium]|nr:HD domain-containing phosphohydrolase [Spirochaetales bacterium]